MTRSPARRRFAAGETAEGKDAMASRRADPKLGQLWQLPLLLLSFALFGYAAWLLIDPQPGPSFEERMAGVRNLLRLERPHAAIEALNRILASGKLDDAQQAQAHLSLAEAVHLGQSRQKYSITANHLQVVEQTRLAIARGAAPDAAANRRLGESYEALGRTEQALEAYRRAMNLDPQRVHAIRRKVIDMLIEVGDGSSADAELELYLQQANLSSTERAWALGERAQILSDAGRFTDAKLLLDQAVRLVSDPASRGDVASIGQVNYRLGYVAWKLGDNDDAERYLRAARELLGVSHPLDADAAYTLGRIVHGRGQSQEAISFYDAVLTSHPGARVAPLARLGRGLARLQLREDEPAMVDLHDVTAEINRKASRAQHRDAVVSGLQQAQKILASRDDNAAALELLAYEQQLVREPAGEYFARLGDVFQRRAEQLDRQAEDAAPAERTRRQQQAREMRVRAADAFVAYSQKLVLSDDKAYGEALWRGIDLYDRAGDLPSAIAALETFATERPDDALAPDALLRLGRAYQAAGLFDKAAAAFQRNQARYPNTLAASKSGVPLAQSLVAKGKDFYGRAEQVLLAVVDNNPLLTPEAEEFKQALFELAQLYHRTERYEQSIARLEEYTERYPQDERVGQLLYLMADSYRKSAALLEGKLSAASAATGTNPGMDLNAAATARAERLRQARELFDRAITHYRGKPPASELDEQYLRSAYLSRADCMFDLGEFEQAIALYDAAAFRYQNDTSALAAYVQIVNAYCSLGKFQEARTANEQAKWLLRRIPPESFSDGSFSMPREYWEQWLQWSSQAGLW
jgi:tetratricopeptide (TPR) repeat protein